MYQPDPRILSRLREYDRDLGARWDRDRERWVITWCGKDAFAAVDDDGGYRPLDERAVTQAKLNDLWSYKSAREYSRIKAEEGHRLSEKQKAKFKDETRQEIIEDGYQKVFGVGQFRGWSPPSEARA